MASLTRWVLSHKRLVTGAWIVITIAAFASIQPASDALSQQFTVPGREGFETNREITARYGSGGDVAPIVPVVTLPARNDHGLARRKGGVRRRRRQGQGCPARIARARRRRVRLGGPADGLRARLDPGQARARARAGGGHAGASRARRRHGRRDAGRVDRPRRAARRLGHRRGRRHEREHPDRGPGRGPGRADRARVRVRLLHGGDPAADGGRGDPDDVPARVAADRRDGRRRS